LVNHLGWEVPEVYGDPALLMNRLYNPPATAAADAPYSICPHYIHKRDVAGRVASLGEARLIDVERDAETVVAELANSRVVISTSLHGLIVAQAYGTPWVWLRIDDNRLAGDTFKFEDFFTTLDRSAVATTTLTRDQLRTADFAAIAKTARVPRSNFDAAALLDAFPYPRDADAPFLSGSGGGGQSMTNRYVKLLKRRYTALFKKSAPEGPTRDSADGRTESAASSEQPPARQDHPIPVILISFNRGPMLRKVIDGYRNQTVPVDIFVHDNGSDDPATCAILDQLEGEGVVVFRRPKINSPEELNLVDGSVQNVFRDRPASPYVVSDCDVSIAQSSPLTLQTYLDVLEAMPGIDCVGPMLRIDDVPTSYPLYNAMMNRHIGAFWSKEPQWTVVNGRQIAFQRAPIDTTLAVYRAGEPFRRLRQGVRLYHPYDARHLDWYPDEHAEAYRASADGSAISNWSNPARETAHRGVALKHTQYRAVVKGEDGSLVAVTKTIAAAGQRPNPDALRGLVQTARENLLPSWSEALGRTWVWRERAGVLEVTFGPSDRLGLDVSHSAGTWQTFAVARTDGMREWLEAAGFEAGSDGRYPLGSVPATDDAAADATAVSVRFDEVLSRVARSRSAR
jgi:hypothetical protein